MVGVGITRRNIEQVRVSGLFVSAVSRPRVPTCSFHAQTQKKEKRRTIEDGGEGPLCAVHVDLPHDEPVLRLVPRAGLKRDRVCEVAARGVEDGPLGLCEGLQALRDVVFGEGFEGAT